MVKQSIILCIFLLSVINGMGHPMPHSILIFDVKADKIFAELKVPLKELQFAVPFDVTQNMENLLEQERRQQISGYFLAHIRPQSLNGLNWKVEIRNISLENTAQEGTGTYQELVLHLLLQPPDGTSVRSFQLYYDAILHQVVTHKTFVTLRQDWQNGRGIDKEQQLGVIELNIANNNISPMAVKLDEGSILKGFISMVWLGIDHIANGTDHLLFLLVLLLPATLTTQKGRWAGFAGIHKSIKSILKIVTAFTVGHSLSLFIGAIQLVLLPSRPVEIAIAITIFITAAHAIWPIFPQKEVLVAALFGLVHGLAFSIVLSELNLDTTELSYSILGYNLGIELMQVFVLILTLPWIIILSKNNHLTGVRIGGAFFALIAAAAWAVERFSMESNFISSGIELILNHGKWLVLMLFCLAVFSNYLTKTTVAIK